jgi:hypothetical protein
MAAPRPPIGGVPFPGYRGGDGGNGHNGDDRRFGCAFLAVFVLVAAAIVTYTLLTR